MSVSNPGCNGTVSGSSEVTANAGLTEFNMTVNDRTIGLDGSENNIIYQLYLNDIPTENETTGTGAAISFGEFNTEGTYTVVAYDQITTCSSEMIGNVTLEFGTNDTQGGAVNISPVESWCSQLQEYSTVGATPDGSATTCLAAGPYNNVWFKFTAVSSNIRIALYTGAENGTIVLPSIALWDNQNNLKECVKSLSTGDTELYLDFTELIPGNVYYISIDNEGAVNAGTFSLCVNNNIGSRVLYAIANGNWTDNIWSLNPNSTVGIGTYPGIDDIVYIIDKVVQVSSSVAAKSVYLIVNDSDANIQVNTGGHVEIVEKVIVRKK
jgi:hypothetical protein